MAEIEELRTMIKCFRMNELQALLSFAGRSKNGKKQELQNRAISLLKLQSEPIAFKIRHLYHSMQKCYYNNYLQYSNTENHQKPSSTSDRSNIIDNISDYEHYEKEDDSISIIDDGQFNKKEESHTITESKSNSDGCSLPSDSSTQLSMNPLYYPVHPNVKFKKLPFYKTLHEILKPASLVAEGYHINQKHSFVFYLTPQQSAAFCLVDNVRQGSQNIQSLLRFCLLKTSSKQDDCFPDGLVVMVNNKYCNIEELPKRKKKDFVTKDPSLPINITPFIKTNTAEENKIDVFWNTNFSVSYAVAAYVVQKKTSEELLNRLKVKSVRNADYTRGMIKDKLREEDDGEIVTTSLRVSLMCPLGKIRLQTPCRATTCQHLQCFDASLFLQMNEKKPVWICPVCDNPAEYDSLFIDGYFVDILSCDKLSTNVNEIELHSDGSWSSITEIKKEDSSPRVKTEPEFEIIDVLVDDSPSSPNENQTDKADFGGGSTHTPKRVIFKPLKKRKFDEIDLTISDSDDEPLIYLKRRESLKNKRNEVLSSGTDSVASSPVSVIELDDSESSNDSLALVLSNSMSASTTPGTLTTTFSSETDVREESGETSKTDESLMPWFAESAIFF